jgi:hypothetical protein
VCQRLLRRDGERRAWCFRSIALRSKKCRSTRGHHLRSSSMYGAGFAKPATLDTREMRIILSLGSAGIFRVQGEQMRNIIIMKPDSDAHRTTHSCFTAARASSVKSRLGLAFGAGLILWTLAQPTAAYAALGESGVSIARDRAALRSSLNTISMKGYDVQELTNESGATVREYVTAAGTVFALTWNGTQVPDLKLLLGAYFDRYMTAAQAHRTGHHVLSIATPDLVMTVVKFQRKSSGQVYVPSLMPNGVTPQELR